MNATSRGSPHGNRAGGPSEEAAHHSLDGTHVRRFRQELNWKRALESALDAVLEAQSGDIGLIERNLVESATEMLAVASEIRRRLRR